MLIIRTTILLVTLIFFSTTAWSGSQVVPIEGISYQVNASLLDNLKGLVGKKVSLYLDGGKTVTGSVKAVSADLIHLEKIQQKEFFDALVRLDKIQGVEVQFRHYPR